MSAVPVLATKRVVEKPWGRTDIGEFAGNLGVLSSARQPRIGEVWFEPGADKVLVKYLFTSKRLSIQVHPDDQQASRMQGARGKDECWLILEADEDAYYGIGLRRQVSAEDLKQAALDGSVVDLVDWRRARVGDFIFNPAGTVHALGPGLTVLEVQQNSDTTLRLFDYGSDRALHIDAAVAVARRTRHHHPFDTHIDFTRSQVLVDDPKFGLAFCNERVPRLPEHAQEIRLVTWKDVISLGERAVPPGAMASVSCVDQIKAKSGQRFFVVWTTGRRNAAPVV